MSVRVAGRVHQDPVVGAVVSELCPALPGDVDSCDSLYDSLVTAYLPGDVDALPHVPDPVPLAAVLVQDPTQWSELTNFRNA